MLFNSKIRCRSSQHIGKYHQSFAVEISPNQWYACTSQTHKRNSKFRADGLGGRGSLRVTAWSRGYRGRRLEWAQRHLNWGQQNCVFWRIPLYFVARYKKISVSGDVRECKRLATFAVPKEVLWCYGIEYRMMEELIPFFSRLVLKRRWL